MNKIILKDINLLNIIKESNSLLPINEFLIKINYNVDNLYLGKFWNNIKDDIWIYIDNEMILWMEYKDIKQGKDKIMKFLKREFKIDEDYKIYNNDEFDINNFCFSAAEEQNNSEESVYVEEKRGAHNKQYITVSPDCFKELCMHIGTKKSKEIKKYYIELEKIFKFYLEYQNQYQNKLLKEKELLLEEKEDNLNKVNAKYEKLFVETINNVEKLKTDGFIYITTNLLNSYNNVNRIGTTKSLKSRKSSTNTNSLIGNENDYLYIHKCYNNEILEKLLHSFLKPFKYKINEDKNENFKLHYKPLSTLVKKICDHYTYMTNMINDYIENDYENDLKLEVITIPQYLSSNKIKMAYINEEEEEYDEEDKYNNIKDDINIDRITADENMILYKGVNLFQCYRCKSFICKDRSIMLDHLGRVYQCPIVEKQDIEIEKLIQDNNIKLYPCLKCNKITFKSVQKLIRHQNSITPCDEIFKCIKCNQQFRTSNELNNHMNLSNCLDINGNIIVNEDISSNSGEITILPLEQNDSEDIFINGLKCYKCNLCNTVFKTKQNLKSHQSKKVKCNALFKCTLCNREFHSIENLKKHQNRMKNCKNLVYECEKCNKQFTSNKNLNRHHKNVKCI